MGGMNGSVGALSADVHSFGKYLAGLKHADVNIPSIEAGMREIAVNSNVEYKVVKESVYGVLVGQPDLDPEVRDLFRDKILPTKDVPADIHQ